MADDYISRQAAINKLESWLKVDGYSEGELNMLKAAIYELRSFPPADVKPVERGKWLWDKHYGEYYCDQCEEMMWGNITLIEEGVWSYCPSCGADMRQRRTDV